MGIDTAWGQRGPGEAAMLEQDTEGKHNLPGEQYAAVLVDPSLSPDWLRMPDTEQLPESLRGIDIRVEGSCWLPIAPNPAGDPDDPESMWIDQRTRWHLLEIEGHYAVAEVVGHGWVILHVGERRAEMLRYEAMNQ